VLIYHCCGGRGQRWQPPALQILVVAREQMTTERTKLVNSLTALLRIVDLGVDARRPLAAA
jgi:hypothetical protein